MAIWSRRTFADFMEYSLSTHKREQEADPDFPTMFDVSENRRGFMDEHCRAYAELKYLKKLAEMGHRVDRRIAELRAIIHGTNLLDAPEETDAA